MGRTEQFAAFSEWLRRRGRGKTTAAEYCHQVKRCFDGEDVLDRLLDEGLSPNTRRLSLAALRAYAKFTSDDDLSERLSDLKLPPPERVSEKVPFDEITWRRLQRAIETDTGINEFRRALLLMICRRGIRVGGVVALTRRQAVDALANDVLVFRSKGRLLRYGIRPIKEQLETLVSYENWDVAADVLCPGSAPSRRQEAATHGMWKTLRRIGETIGIPRRSMHPHRLRHTCATHFYLKTRDIVALQQYMQWADIKTAARYVAHIDRASLDDIAMEVLGE